MVVKKVDKLYTFLIEELVPTWEERGYKWWGWLQVLDQIMKDKEW